MKLTDCEKMREIKRIAKANSKLLKIPLWDAQERIAKDLKYASWYHLRKSFPKIPRTRKDK